MPRNEGMAASSAFQAAERSGLIRRGEPLLAMVSGGADSVCLLDVAVRLGARVSALHVNYGLRDEADEDEAVVRALCEQLGSQEGAANPRPRRVDCG